MVKRSPTLGTLVSTKTKCIKLIYIGKLKLVPAAFFNGFKYIFEIHVVNFPFLDGDVPRSHSVATYSFCESVF